LQPQKTEAEKAQDLVKAAVLTSLKDPESARFGKFTLVTSEHACLTVNAKNGFGGYTGDQQAYAVKSAANGWQVLAIEGKLGHEQCIKILSEKKPG
jgi:hypothetical protein